jgi:signal transduction histidine kinase
MIASLILIGWVASILLEAMRTPEWEPLTRPGLLLTGFIFPLIIAAVYWGVGVFAWRLRTEAISSVYFLTFGALLAAGVLSSINNLQGSWFAVLQIWIAPLFLHLHMQVLTPQFPGRGRWFIRLFYGFSVALTIPLLFVSVAEWETQSWFPLWRIALRLNIAIAIVTTIALVGFFYNRNNSALQQRKIRLLLSGTLLAVAPLLLLSILPELFRSPYAFPYPWTLPFLILNPISYAYVLGIRHQQFRFEVAVQRFASYYLALTFAIGLFFVGTSLLYIAFAPFDFDESWVVLLVSIAILLLFNSLVRECHRLIQRIWYGRQMTSQHLSAWLSDSLSRTLDWQSLAHLLTNQFPTAMLLQHATIYVEKEPGQLTLLGTTSNAHTTALPLLLPPDGTIVSTIQRIAEPVTHEEIRTALDLKLLTAEEQTLLQSPFAYWIPLLSRGQIHGIMMLGARLGNDWITADDIYVLDMLVNQAGQSAHNIRLFEEVRAGRHDLAEAHQQLLVARENERQGLARELHDDAVQQLIGIGYQIELNQRRFENGNKPVELEPVVDTLTEVNTNVVDVIRSLRMLIRELRPTGLEKIGLIPTLHAHLKNLQLQYPAIQFNLESDPITTYLPEDVIMGLFRVTQEAIRNAIRHADPHAITVTVHYADSKVILQITDDGKGFEVPPDLQILTRQNHFGLTGMQERTQLMGGTYRVEAAPGQGTTVQVTIPVRGHHHHD